MRAGNVVIDIADGAMQVVATRVTEDSSLAHTRIKDVSKAHEDFHFRIVAIARGINTIIPKGDHEILPQDHVFILAHSKDQARLMKLAGVSHERRHRVLIIGGGLIGSRVAQLLEDSFPVTLLEQNEARAEELAHHLRSTQCLHGNGSESDTLVKAGLLEMDTIIAATGDNETNIMSTVLAKHLIRNHSTAGEKSKGKTIALVKREDYLVLASSMGADIVLNKKVLAGNGLLFWRSETHLLGGMGFLSLTVIFLPHGMGGLRIFRAESSPGQVITREKFTARNRDAMFILWTIYLVLNVLEIMLLCLGVLVSDMDYQTGMSSVIATLMNIGPGFGAIGPSENYAHISDVGKWFLSWCMLVGRLEMFTALVVFYPSFWRR